MHSSLRSLAPVALLAVIALAGCSAPAGDDAEPQGASSAPASQSSAAEEEAAPAELIDAATLEGYVEAAGLQPIDIEGQGGVEALAGGLAGFTVEPAECQALIDSSFALTVENESTVAIGADQEAGVSGGIMSFADPSVVADALERNAAAPQTCAQVTLTAEDGTEVASRIEAVDVDIPGADDVFALRTVASVAGTEMTSVSVSASVGNAIATGSTLMTDDVAAATTVTQALVDQLAG
ncbi:hypothetical protein [Microbacterium sp. NPDC096154]|uniref:hypothetical protein n=1 Tax=Microbacterium sp. NPDC096154 TaxID=3155549 RepID=UPI0033342DDA